VKFRGELGELNKGLVKHLGSVVSGSMAHLVSW
jgi:hypothetical protein